MTYSNLRFVTLDFAITSVASIAFAIITLIRIVTRGIRVTTVNIQLTLVHIWTFLIRPGNSVEEGKVILKTLWSSLVK